MITVHVEALRNQSFSSARQKLSLEYVIRELSFLKLGTGVEEIFIQIANYLTPFMKFNEI